MSMCAIFFCIEEFDDTLLAPMRFHVRCWFVRLSVTRQKICYRCDGLTFTAISPSSASVMDKYNKIGGTTF